jgi:hopanoid biosynthesis associated protein HpnK
MIRAAIINGDDFGLSPGINRGIIEAHADGILTSASLMSVGDAFKEAVIFSHEYPSLSLGIHLTLIEGLPVLPAQKVPSLVRDDGHFCESLGVFLLKWITGQIRMTDVEREFSAQVEKALDHGVKIDKLDSHMHVHLLPGIFQAVLAVAGRYRIRAVRLPKERIVGQGGRLSIGGLWRRATLTSLAAFRGRPLSAAEIFHSTRFCGLAESGHLNEERFLRVLRGLQPGVTEVMVHPGYRDSIIERWPKSRRYEREQELTALTSPKVKTLIGSQQIKLVSYPTAVQGQVTL